jgi:hypothetical protein
MTDFQQLNNYNIRKEIDNIRKLPFIAILERHMNLNASFFQIKMDLESVHITAS